MKEEQKRCDEERLAFLETHLPGMKEALLSSEKSLPKGKAAISFKQAVFCKGHVFLKQDETAEDITYILVKGSVEFLRSEKLTPPRSILGNSDGEVRPGVVVARPGGVGRSLWCWSLHPLMSTFELQEVVERRAQKAKELHGAVRLWFIYFFTWVDLWSHLVVVMATWFSTAYIMLPYLAIHFAMAARRSSLREAIKAPLTWLVPEGGSTLHTSGCYTWVFYLVSYVLRGGCAVLYTVIGRIQGGEGGAIHPYEKHWESGHACDGLPPWLRHPWWSSEATCPINGTGYNRCLETVPWWRAGHCNIAAASKGASFDTNAAWEFLDWVDYVGYYGALQVLFEVASAGRFHFEDYVGFGSIMSPLCALTLVVVAWTLWAVFRCLAWCWACLSRRNAGQVEENGQMLPVDHAQIKPREPPSMWSQAMVMWPQAMVAKDIGLFCFDILSDLNGIGTFIYTGNFQFAGFSGLVFALSFGQQLATGGFRTFRQEAANSWSQGCLTDGLRRLTLTEKSVEAPLQLLVQFFSFFYVTSNNYALYSFSGSMLLSLFSVVDAAYMLIELDLLREFSLQEVSTSYLSERQVNDLNRFLFASKSWHRLERAEMAVLQECHEGGIEDGIKLALEGWRDLLHVIRAVAQLRPRMLRAIQRLREQGFVVAALTNNFAEVHVDG
eukprot:symbB.v1.2.006185.t2/scaffold367.1/size382069/18